MEKFASIGAALLFAFLAVSGENACGEEIQSITDEDSEGYRESVLQEGIPALSIGREGTLKVGMRIQPRYEFDEFDNTHDLMIRRSRIKLQGQFIDEIRYKLRL